MLELLDWRIEPAAYASGLVAVLPPDLAMPRCYAVRPVDDGSAVVWLEAVAHAERARTDATWSGPPGRWAGWPALPPPPGWRTGSGTRPAPGRLGPLGL